jgi:hypothetical protein
MVTHTDIGRYVIITGNVVDGLVFIGPFVSRMKAMEYAEAHCSRVSGWVTAEMLEPNKREGRLP